MSGAGRPSFTRGSAAKHRAVFGSAAGPKSREIVVPTPQVVRRIERLRRRRSRRRVLAAVVLVSAGLLVRTKASGLSRVVLPDLRVPENNPRESPQEPPRNPPENRRYTTPRTRIGKGETGRE